MKNLNQWQIGSYLAAIFLAGVVAGAVVGYKAARRTLFAPPRPESVAARACDELQTKLDLTPAQAQKIKIIINEGTIRFQTIVGAEILTAFSNSNVRVASELTPEQKVKFAEIQKEHEEFLHKRFKDAPEDSPRRP